MNALIYAILNGIIILKLNFIYYMLNFYSHINKKICKEKNIAKVI